MKKLISILMLSLLIGCAATPVTDSPDGKPKQFETGKEVKPLYGCREMRKRDPEADC